MEAIQSMVNYAFTMSVLEEWWNLATVSWEKGARSANNQCWVLTSESWCCHWLVGAYMAPLLDFGYLPRLAQQELALPTRGGGPNPWIFPPLLDSTTFSGRINPSALQVQLEAAWCNASVHVFSYGRTSLGALFSMMMNGALKSELLVESWAWSGLIILAMVFWGGEHLSVWGLLNSELAGCLTSLLTTRFTSRLPQPLPGFVCCFVCFCWGLFWFCFVVQGSSCRLLFDLEFAGTWPQLSWAMRHWRKKKRKKNHVLDLTKSSDLDILFDIALRANVASVHFAPPCSTSSKARERPLPEEMRSVKSEPLRSITEPLGKSGLQGTDAKRVAAANRLYAVTLCLMVILVIRGAAVSVENPRNSYFGRLWTSLQRNISGFATFGIHWFSTSISPACMNPSLISGHQFEQQMACTMTSGKSVMAITHMSLGGLQSNIRRLIFLRRNKQSTQKSFATRCQGAWRSFWCPMDQSCLIQVWQQTHHWRHAIFVITAENLFHHWWQSTGWFQINLLQSTFNTSNLWIVFHQLWKKGVLFCLITMEIWNNNVQLWKNS